MRSLVLVLGLLVATNASAQDARQAGAELGSPYGDPPAAAIEAPAARPRIRTFSLSIPFSIGLVGGLFGTTRGEVGTGTLGLAVYGRLTPWASLGARILIFGLGGSSVEGVLLSGGISLPSVRFSFREELDAIVAIECGVHVEGGFFGGNHHSPLGSGAFGFGGGFDVALDLGPSNAIVLDVVANGWGARGGYTAWTLLSLGYLVRFD